VEIITTHTNADMDALASMVAAQKLYPGAVMVFPGPLLKNVEEFMALHKDTFRVLSLRDVVPESVERIIMVDTRSPGRLDKLASLLEKPGVDVHIYDHHPGSGDDAAGSVEAVEMVGATTTILVEKIRERRLDINPIEATVLAMGIYEDTGSLLFSNTTPRDAEAVAFLLARGANLSVVADFLGRPLTEKQRSLLKALLVSAERFEINGVKFLIARGSTDEYVGGLDLVTHKLVDFAHLDAVFTVVEMEEHVHVVARSSIPELSVKEVLSVFGGGGHPSAASAVIKRAKAEEVARMLLEVIKARIKPPATAADIMSSPVKTVTPETVVEEAGKIMLRYGHTGLPVVKDERVVGVISRRDVEKALHHGLGHAPVKGFMATNLLTVAPEAPVSAVRDLMIRHDIGRLPVLKDGELVGIISRSDVLRTLHGEAQVRRQTICDGRKSDASYRNIRELMSRELPPGYLEIMESAGRLAFEMGYRVYAAGGLVRDLLLGAECLDIDLVVEGEGIELARALGKNCGGSVRVHPKFGTATVAFPDGRQVDVATARVEFYQYPAAMPQIEASSLHQDLYRRDFTINAMAVSLNKKDFGEIIDFFGGREDLDGGLIRVLHNLSFVEDPIRLLRGVRFEKRFSMSMEPQTLKLAREAVKNGMLSRVAVERLWEEVKHILMEPRQALVLSRLYELQMWNCLYPGVEYVKIKKVLEELPRSARILQFWNLVEPADPWMVYFLAVLHLTDWNAVKDICRRYNFGKRLTEKVAAALGGWRRAVEYLQSPAGGIALSETARHIMSVPAEAYPLILTYLPGNVSKTRFRQLLTAIFCDRPSINGKDLRDMGFEPGPSFRKALDAVWQARIDGLVRSRKEELKYAREFLEGYQGALKNV